MGNDLSSLKNQFSFQKKEWMVKLGFWVLMSLFIAAGLMGFLGHGPISEQVIEHENFSVHYEKFLRVKNESELVISTFTDKEFSVSFNNDYFKKIRVIHVFPEAKSMDLIDNTLVMKFSGKRKGDIIFFLEPVKMGSQDLDLEINGKPIQLNQFIYF